MNVLSVVLAVEDRSSIVVSLSVDDGVLILGSISSVVTVMVFPPIIFICPTHTGEVNYKLLLGIEGSTIDCNALL